MVEKFRRSNFIFTFILLYTLNREMSIHTYNIGYKWHIEYTLMYTGYVCHIEYTLMYIGYECVGYECIGYVEYNEYSFMYFIKGFSYFHYYLGGVCFFTKC